VTDAGWLAWACEHLSVLRRADADRTRRIEAGIAGGSDVTSELEAMATALGLPGPQGPTRTVPGAQLPMPARPAREVLVCPSTRCARAAVRRPGVPVPLCQIDGIRLRLTRV
jgi:hypothetical protein